MNALGDFWGKITGSGSSVTETKVPALSKYPSQDDAREALRYGFGYGTGNEPYIEDRQARVMGESDNRGNFRSQSGAGMLLEQAIGAVDDEKMSKSLNLDLMQNWGLKEKLGTTFAQAALAVNRNPIATFGFDPSRTVMDVVTKNANIGGAYEAKRDAIYSNLSGIEPSNVVHESIHRGLEKLRQKSPEAKKLLDKLPAEEYVVRWMMKDLAGDPEKGSGDIGDKQRASAIGMFEGSYKEMNEQNKEHLARLMEIAAELRKDQRSRGPR